MIINSNNKKYKKQNNRKILINNGKQTIKVSLKDLLLKYKFSRKNLSKHFETINSSFNRKRNIKNTNRHNISKFRRIKNIQKINLGQNSYSPYNKLQYENKLDTRRINKNSTLKNVVRLNNNIFNKSEKSQVNLLYNIKKI